MIRRVNQMSFAQRVVADMLKGHKIPFEYGKRLGVGNRVDFYIENPGVAIEIEGLRDRSPGKAPLNTAKQERIENRGDVVLRFSGYGVLENRKTVMEVIKDAMKNPQKYLSGAGSYELRL